LRLTLTGHVANYNDKWNAEKVAKRVAGVKAVANEIEVALNIRRCARRHRHRRSTTGCCAASCAASPRTGLSTDTTRDHDYTDWAAVDLFVRKFVHPMERRASSGYATCLHAR